MKNPHRSQTPTTFHRGRKRNATARAWRAASLLALCTIPLVPTHGAELNVNSGSSENFGRSVGASGSFGFVGSESLQKAYFFRDLDSATGTVKPDTVLGTYEGSVIGFGFNISLEGTSGLVSGFGAKIGSNTAQGAAYLYRDLDTAAETVTETAKLVALGGKAGDSFGYGVSLSGSYGLVGASGVDIGANIDQGVAYLYRGLDTATGTVNQQANLIASDGGSYEFYGRTVSLSGNIGVVGAFQAKVGGITQGAAYVFRDLDTATGTVMQDVKLIASDESSGLNFGYSVSNSGSMALIGGYGTKIEGVYSVGAAYLYRDLDTTSETTVMEDAKLIASDGTIGDNLGYSVSLSGNVGLAGAYLADAGNGATGRGAAYLYLNLDQANGVTTESVKLFASSGSTSGGFATSVSINGDAFLIGDTFVGKAYSGSVSSVTTLDEGNTSRTISKISFISKEDWVIGKTTDGNEVILSAGDSARVNADGKKIVIGAEAGSDHNRLVLQGKVTASLLQVGSAGNVGNMLQLDDSTTLTVDTVAIYQGNGLLIEGELIDLSGLRNYLGNATLEIWQGDSWTVLNEANFNDYFTMNFENDYTLFVAVPEPSTWVLASLGVAFLIGVVKRARPRGGHEVKAGA